MNRRGRRSLQGFTLVELLVALFVLSLLAMLSWRALDGMVRTQSQTQARSDEVLALQVGLAQWNTDLDALIQLPQLRALEWNGRVLRLTRIGPGKEGVVVAAWAQRMVNGRGTWLRWQSPVLSTRGQVEEAWLRADNWSQNPGDAERAREVAITPLAEWQVFYYRNDAWVHPQSSDVPGARGQPAPPPPQGPPAAPSATMPVLPDGVRLVLALPAGQAISGTLTVDWVSPRVAGSRS